MAELQQKQLTEPTWGDTFLTGAARFGLPIVGGLAGAFGGPLGAAAGGGIGGSAGETLAEMYEKARGIRNSINPYQVATQGALSAIPIPGAGKAASVGKAVLTHAGMGAVMGGVGTGATSLAETGELPSMQELLAGAGTGAVLSGAIGGVLHKNPLSAAIPSADANLEHLRAAQNAPPTTNPVLAKLLAVGPNLNRRYADRFRDVRALETQAEKAGVTFPTMHDRPSNVLDARFGGGSGDAEDVRLSLQGIKTQAEEKGVLQPTTDRLNLAQMTYEEKVLRERAVAMLQDPDPDVKMKGADLFAKVMNGEALPKPPGMPKGFNINRIAESKRNLLASLTPAQQQDVEAAAQGVFDINRNELERAHRGNTIGDAAYNTIIARGKEYVPGTRIMEDAQRSGVGGNKLDLPKQHVLFPFEGSERTTVDPWQASFDRAQTNVKDVAKNEMARSVGNLPNVDPFFAAHVREVHPSAQPRPGFGIIKALDNGEHKAFEVPEGIAKALTLEDHGDMPGSALLKVTRNIAQKMMTTWNVPFSVVNVIKDIQDTRKLSPAHIPINLANPMTWAAGAKDLASFGKQWGQAWLSVARQDPDYRRFLRAGASYSGLQKNLSREAFEAGPQSLIDRAFHPIEKLNNRNEEATKLATFNRHLASGASDFDAAVQTRGLAGSPDFGRGGTHSVIANQLVMFFNAQVQGTTRNMRFLKNPKNLAMAAASATVAETALYNWNRQFQDADGTLSYSHVNDADKQANWIIMQPSTYTSAKGTELHNYVKVPKGHINRLLHNPIGQAIESFYNEGNASLGQAALDVVSNVLPGSVNLKKGDIWGSSMRGAVSSTNPAVHIPVEWVLNQDTYRNSPIESKHLQDLSVEQRFNRITSPTMITVSKVLKDAGVPQSIGASPQKLQHAFQSIVPGLGESGLSLIDAAQRDRIPLEGGEKLTQTPVAGPLIRRFIGGGFDQIDADRMSKFYDTLAKAQTAVKDRAHLAQGDPAEARAYVAQHKVLLQANAGLQNYASALADIRKYRDKLTIKPTPDAADKLKLIGQREHMLLQRIDKLLTDIESRQGASEQ